ncbi:FAD-dependent oxidoreductase [Candidatus Woesearchaeota archaeon]|nr:FAD-dependent oxidoreductase [Candidatus Woesearchaeota archaeon]
MIYETVIVGAGIAGVTAAIYASRKRMNYLFISNNFGGQMNIAGDVENYPGIVKTTASDFMKVLKKQLDYNKIKMTQELVKGIKKKGQNFELVTDKNKYETRTVILCTGARPRRLNVPGEVQLSKKGVSYCAICDGPVFKNMEVAVIGGGDAGLEAVDFLLNIAKKIYILERGPKLLAQKYLLENIRGNPKVEIILNAETKEIIGDKMVTGLKYVQEGKKKLLKVKGIFVEIGRVPNTEMIKGLVDLDEHNHIKVSVQCDTSVPGIYAAGDCTNIHEYQYVISGGQGATALIKAARYLAGGKNNGKNNTKKK